MLEQTVATEIAPPSADDAAREFQALLVPVMDAAFGAALNLTRNRADAEDVVQEAALRAFRAFDSFERGTNFKAWFFRILLNVFYTTCRRRKRELEHFQDEPIEEDAPPLYLYNETRRAGLHAESPDPAAMLLGRIDADAIEAALASLPDDYRDAAVLYFVQEFSYAEIAEVLGCPVGTVRSRLHRGRRLLQKRLWSVAVERGIVPDAAPARALARATVP